MLIEHGWNWKIKLFRIKKDKVFKQITDYWRMCPQTHPDRLRNNLLCWRSVVRRSNPKQSLGKCPVDIDRTNELERMEEDSKRKSYHCNFLSIGIDWCALTFNPIQGIRMTTDHWSISERVLLRTLLQLHHLSGNHDTRTSRFHGIWALFVLFHWEEGCQFVLHLQVLTREIQIGEEIINLARLLLPQWTISHCNYIDHRIAQHWLVCWYRSHGGPVWSYLHERYFIAF